MKLPYRAGDSFALPLGDGRFADSCIVHADHRVVTISASTRNDGDVVVLRTSDDALINRRWKPQGRRAYADVQPENTRWMRSAHAERVVASRCGIDGARDRPTRVIEVHDGCERIPGDVTSVALTETLDAATLDVVLGAISERPTLSVRCSAAAHEHLRELFGAGLQRAVIAGPFEQLPPSEAIEDIRIVGGASLPAVAGAFPQLRALTWLGRGRLDLAPLEQLTRLQTLSVSGVEIRGSLPSVSALRLARISGLPSLQDVDVRTLHALAIEHVHDLTSIDWLSEAPLLEQLELRGMWQFGVDDARFTLDLPNLRRAEIDIGGRRKNMELYRHASWAYPWPFPGIFGA